MPSSRPLPADRQRAIDAARNTVRNATYTIARDAGATIITRPSYPGSDRTVRDVEPLAGLVTARDLELAARATARDHIRSAREAGHSWHEIGEAMSITPNGDPQQSGDTIAEAAYTYAAGHPDTEHARFYGRSVTWTCHACDNTISDRGLDNGPADDEHGHARNCPRLEATIAALDAEWDEKYADQCQSQSETWEAETAARDAKCQLELEAGQ
jgi:hypothetical protein